MNFKISWTIFRFKELFLRLINEIHNFEKKLLK